MLIFLIPIVAAVAIAIALGVQQRRDRQNGKDADDGAQVFFTISRRK